MNSKRVLLTMMLAGSMFALLPSVKVNAEGSMNGNEQAVISALSGEFTVDGEIYVVDSTYLAALQEYFSQDGVDISASQKSRAINEISGNLHRAIQEGYLVKTGRKAELSATEQQTTVTTDSDEANSGETVTESEQPADEKGKKDKKKKKNKVESTKEPEEMTVEEEQALREKYKEQIAAVEENAANIKAENNGDAGQADDSGSEDLFDNALKDTEDDYAPSLKEDTKKENTEVSQNKKENNISHKKNSVKDLVVIIGGTVVLLLAIIALIITIKKKK